MLFERAGWSGAYSLWFKSKREVPMWFDDASLLCLEEADWKVGNERDELGATMRDEDSLELVRFDETWCGGSEVLR